MPFLILFLVAYVFAEDIATEAEPVQPLGITLSVIFPYIFEDSPGNFIKPIDGTGFKFGLTYDIFCSNSFNLQPSINLKRAQYYGKVFKKGYLENMNVRSDNVKLDLYYIEFPVLFIYKLSFFRIDAGPYISTLVGGSAKNLYNTFDYGFHSGLGFNFGKHIYLVGFIDYGMANLSKINDFTVNNFAPGITLGYKL